MKIHEFIDNECKHLVDMEFSALVLQGVSGKKGFSVVIGDSNKVTALFMSNIENLLDRLTAKEKTAFLKYFFEILQKRLDIIK
jgi:hypothetical protein